MPSIYANPRKFINLSQGLWKGFALASVIFLSTGLYFALTAPPDYQQGLTIRILFLHVPAAWMAMMVYGFMAVCAVAAFIWRVALADIAAQSAALIGLVWTLLALFSGALWGKPIWGAFWVWDARLVSVLVLFFLYIGYLALCYAIEERHQRAVPARLLALLGAVNLPVIKFSVEWWNTLHQPASIMRLEGPAMPPVYLLPLGLMAGFAFCLTVCLLAMRMRSQILRHRMETHALTASGGRV